MKKGEVKTIEEIGLEIYSGNGITKAQLDTGNYPAVRYSDIFNWNVQINECR